jgi:hypothetical protein
MSDTYVTNAIAEYERKMAELNRDDAAAKAAGKLVGRYITHPVADGQAIYKIVKAGPRITIEVVDVADGYMVPAWGRRTTITARQAMAFLAQRDAWTALGQRHENWWAKQQIGATVHYHNGFGEYVRGVVVEDGGEKKMRPTALVGNWKHQRDIYTRSPDGTVTPGYHAKQIQEGTPFQPNEGNMVESPTFKLVGADPRTMTPISLEVPPMTIDQENLAKIATLHGNVLAALKHDHSSEPIILNAAILASLRRAKELLADV